MPSKPNHHNDRLSDRELLDREAHQRVEYLRSDHREARSRGTTYKLLDASPGLMRAWEKWKATSIAVRLRGLLPRLGE